MSGGLEGVAVGRFQLWVRSGVRLLWELVWASSRGVFATEAGKVVGCDLGEVVCEVDGFLGIDRALRFEKVP